MSAAPVPEELEQRPQQPQTTRDTGEDEVEDERGELVARLDHEALSCDDDVGRLVARSEDVHGDFLSGYGQSLDTR